MTESHVLRRCLLKASAIGARLFRNNVGTATTGDGSRIRFGLCKGSGDLVGWTPRTVTPDMVGRTVAVFTSIEIKCGMTRVTKEQRAFQNAVTEAGGIAVICRSEQEALAAMTATESHGRA